MAYQSLYRRYRPKRFSEVRGQQHLVNALQNAVRDDRVGHAYLLSGPRGTGKTTTARILAKALNCEHTVDGEPCCECESCLAIDAGTSFDVHELDAASNNGVEAVRDLIARAGLGTPGRTKVYILDEAHMLSNAASNALLKTLEEPPEHVVFVLATTDPQKVLPTILSRTQHFDVHLLSAEDLGGLVDFVIDDAGLTVSPEGRAHALREGRGSARDTLSALERIVAAGDVPDDSDVVDELIEALCESDTAAALSAVEKAMNRGRNPRTLGEALISRLRDVFLASVNADLSRLSADDRARVGDQAHRLGAPGATRALEVLGDAFVGISNATDPRIPLDVALVRLTRLDADTSIAALADRVARLERGLPAGAAAHAPAPAAAPSSTPSIAAEPHDDAPDTSPVAASGRPADQARAALRQNSGAADASSRPAPPRRPARPGRSTPTSAPAAEAPRAEPAPAPAPPATPPPAAAEPQAEAVAAPVPAAEAEAPTAPTTTGSMPSVETLSTMWSSELLSALPAKVKARYSGGHWVSIDGTSAVFGLPNAVHAQRCEEFRGDVEAALAARFGVRPSITLVVDGSAPDPTMSRARTVAAAPPSTDDFEYIDDVAALTDATDASASGVDRIAAMFPGAELLDRPPAD